MTDLLNVHGLRAGYGPVEVLHGLDFTVGNGEIVVILGANGAGKTTTMRAVSGTIPRHGTITYDGHDLTVADREVEAVQHLHRSVAGAQSVDAEQVGHAVVPR